MTLKSMQAQNSEFLLLGNMTPWSSCSQKLEIKNIQEPQESSGSRLMEKKLQSCGACQWTT